MFDLHNSIQCKQSFGLTDPTGCLPPRVNLYVARLRLSAIATRRRAATPSSRPSAWEPRASPHAPFSFQNGCCPFLFFPWNESIEELSSLLRPIKGVGSLKIRHHIHSLSYIGFLLCKNSLLSELKSPPPPLLTARPHLSLRHPSYGWWGLGEPLFLPKHPRWNLVHHSRRTLELRRVLTTELHREPNTCHNL
jgi:hypothetical protein